MMADHGDADGFGAALPAIGEEDLGRAEMYRCLALLLEGPPARTLLDVLQGWNDDTSDIGRAMTAVAAAAGRMGEERIAREYNELFVGVPVPRFMPYASYYGSGQLFGRALAELRIELGRLGIARHKEATEPEDHIATLLEVMAGLIVGAFGGAPTPLSEQAAFFSRHLQPWAGQFFTELEASEHSEFYGEVARLGARFAALEAEGFRMV